MKKLLLFLFILNLFSMNGNAQVVDSSKMSLGWVDFGIGDGFLKYNEYSSAPNIGISYGHYLSKFCYQVGYDADIDVYGPAELFGNVHLDLGKRSCDMFSLLSAFIGPAYMWGQLSDNASTFHTIGINANVQFIIKPVFLFGIGFELFANVCSQERDAGFRIVCHFTNINNKKTKAKKTS